MRKPVLESLEDAVRRNVKPGDVVYLGNFGAQLFCVGHEIIRQGVRDLDLILPSGGILMDQLLGAGLLRSATYSHCWSPVGPTPTFRFRHHFENGDKSVEFHELSFGLFIAALTAGAWNVPFMPVPGLDGTGYVDEDWSAGMVSGVESPWGPARVVQALTPDVAFVHVDRADEWGNGVVRGPIGDVGVAAQASRRVVLVAEELTSSDEVRVERVTVPGVLVSSVVCYPGAVAPDGAMGRYGRDVAAYLDYCERAATKEGFDDWLREEIL